MNLFVIRSTILNLSSLKNISKCCYATNIKQGVLNDLNVEDEPSYDIEPQYTEEELYNIRNKSGLNPCHENILNKKKPYDESKEWYHDTVWYRKKLLGQYGIKAANVTPAIAWPSQEEVDDVKEYERVSNPLSIQEALKQIKINKEAEALKIRKREEAIDKAQSKLGEWKNNLKEKMRKKAMEKYEAREKKRKSLEEVRQKYGYNISYRDARVKEFLQEKALEDKKKKKLLSKEQKAERALQYLKKQQQKQLDQDSNSPENEEEKIN